MKNTLMPQLAAFLSLSFCCCFADSGRYRSDLNSQNAQLASQVDLLLFETVEGVRNYGIMSKRCPSYANFAYNLFTNSWVEVFISLGNGSFTNTCSCRRDGVYKPDGISATILRMVDDMYEKQGYGRRRKFRVIQDISGSNTAPSMYLVSEQETNTRFLLVTSDSSYVDDQEINIFVKSMDRKYKYVDVKGGTRTVNTLMAVPLREKELRIEVEALELCEKCQYGAFLNPVFEFSSGESSVKTRVPSKIDFMNFLKRSYEQLMGLLTDPYECRDCGYIHSAILYRTDHDNLPANQYKRRR